MVFLRSEMICKSNNCNFFFTIHTNVCIWLQLYWCFVRPFICSHGTSIFYVWSPIPCYCEHTHTYTHAHIVWRIYDNTILNFLLSSPFSSLLLWLLSSSSLSLSLLQLPLSSLSVSSFFFFEASAQHYSSSSVNLCMFDIYMTIRRTSLRRWVGKKRDVKEDKTGGGRKGKGKKDKREKKGSEIKRG